MESKDLLYGAGIIVTLVLGLWNLVQANKARRKTNFINTVTSQRVKWIELLRNDISSFVGRNHFWAMSHFYEAESQSDKEESKKILKEIDRLRYLIRLRLNPEGRKDQRIEELVKEIPDLTRPEQEDDLKSALDKLTREAQGLFKEEWEKVKAEAKDGDLKELSRKPGEWPGAA